MFRIGSGYDAHRLVEGRPLILGGVEIPYTHGLLGHSDADVLCHAIIDAIVGALGAGDIGVHFPDTEDKWKDASSIKLLAQIIELSKTKGFVVQNIDSTIIAERPRLRPFIEAMKECISKTGIPITAINIKAKTNEGMGLIGNEEGMAAQAVCLLKPV